MGTGKPKLDLACREKSKRGEGWDFSRFQGRLMITVEGKDWNKNLSLREGPKAFHAGEDFGKVPRPFLIGLL